MNYEDQFVVIRVYRPCDEEKCSKLMHEGVMSMVRPSFFSALTREVTFQIMIAMAAVMFVFAELSPKICILAIPFTVIFIYICVYFSHLQRASDAARDASNIGINFMSSKYTCFWVAEIYERFSSKTTLAPSKYTVLREHQLDSRVHNDRSYSKKIIGIVGINRCDVMYESAWLRRMTVNHKYQRKGIGTALLNEAIEFCQDRGYETIELVTSECHEGARKLYTQKGFKLRQLYHKSMLGQFVQVLMYQFSLAIPLNVAEKKMH